MIGHVSSSQGILVFIHGTRWKGVYERWGLKGSLVVGKDGEHQTERFGKHLFRRHGIAGANKKREEARG